VRRPHLSTYNLATHALPVYKLPLVPLASFFVMKPNTARRFIPLLTLCVTCAGCRPGARVRRVQPREHWRQLSAEEAGFNPDRLTAFASHVGGSGCLVRHGYMVHRWGHYAHPLDVASATKPVYAHLVYKAVEAGLIESLDAPLRDVHPGLARLNEKLGFKDARITWRQLITQTACYGVEESPGTAFNYSDYQVALLLDTLVLRVMRIPYGGVDEKLLAPFLSGPLQCQDKPTLNSGRSPVGRLRISARDFARFGLLYLRRGRWHGKQVVPLEDALRAVGTPHPPSLPRTQQVPAEMLPGQRTVGSGENQEAHMNSYSYAWWTNGKQDDGQRVLPDVPPDAYMAEGHAGHDALVVIPSLDIVVCWIGGFEGKLAFRYCEDGHRRANAALKLLVASLESPEAEDGP